MRLVSGILAGAILASAIGGCASISGLDQFTSGDCVEDCDASLDQSVPSDETATATMESSTGAEDVDGADGADPPDTGEQTGPETGAEAGGPDSGGDSGDAGNHSNPDAGRRSDAAAEGGECGPQTCSSGCCDEHDNCTVTSASTCGTGGLACQNCASGGQICSEGACATPDAGGDGEATCSPSTCLNICVPYFHQCCKTDDTCGCSLNFPTGPCE